MAAGELNDELAAVGRSRRSLDRAASGERLARAKLEAAMVRAAVAGASQREIAARAAVSQPYVHRVVTERAGRFVPRSELGFLLAANRDALRRVLDRHGIREASVFGSVARGEDRPGSDIDLAVEIPEDMGLIALAKVERELAALLGVEVELVPARLLKDDVRSAAAADLVPL
jgi:uncharacterized protein